MHNLQLFARKTTEEKVSFIFSPRPEDAHDKTLNKCTGTKTDTVQAARGGGQRVQKEIAAEDGSKMQS